MKAIELAKQLAKALAESEEFHKYQAAKQGLEGHEAARIMLADFRKKQWELEQKRLNGDQLLEPAQQELQKLGEIVSLNPYIRDYLMAEMEFAKLMLEVQRLIGEAVGLETPATAESETAAAKKSTPEENPDAKT